MPIVNHSYIPRPPLSAFVSSFWLHESDSCAHAQERVLPTGTTELVINMHDGPETLFDAVVCGPHSESFVIDTARKVSVLSVHFKVGGAFPFLGVPPSALHNLVVSADALWGASGRELREQVLDSRTPDGKFQVIEHWLLAHAACPLVQSPAVRGALQVLHTALPTLSVSDIAAQLGLSTRHFTRMFRAEVGLTPKLFQRTLRFQMALQAIEAAVQVDWTTVALSCGYYDQAHFIHDFRAFSGLTPTEYLVQRGVQFNHVPNG